MGYYELTATGAEGKEEIMETLAIIAIVWAVIGLPIGIAIGKWLKRQDGR